MKKINLFGVESIIGKLGKENITDKWVVIKPDVIKDVYKTDYQTKENQIVKVRCGFGCKDGSLSVYGGKVFVTLINGIEEWNYRNEILGIANQETLKEMGIHE